MEVSGCLFVIVFFSDHVTNYRLNESKVHTRMMVQKHVLIVGMSSYKLLGNKISTFEQKNGGNSSERIVRRLSGLLETIPYYERFR